MVKNTFKKSSLMLVFILLFSGCSTWSTSNVQKTSHKVEKVVQAEKILISEKEIVDKKYIVLGELDVTVNKTTIFHKDPTKEAVNEKLKEEASKLGADAVIFVRYGAVGVSMMSWGSLNGKGRAIKFVK